MVILQANAQSSRMYMVSLSRLQFQVEGMHINGSVNTAGRPYVLTGPDGRTYVHDSSNGNLIPYNP